jgi:hypothetical protein
MTEEHLSPRRFRFRAYTLGPDRRLEAEPVTFVMRCASCPASGPASADGAAGTAWALLHLKSHPGHVDYWEYVTRPYRAVAGEWL